jgi:hypothetical protein
MSSIGFYLKGFMEKFLLRMDTSQDLRKKFAAIDTECDVEYHGSRVLKDIMILVGFINCMRMSEMSEIPFV